MSSRNKQRKQTKPKNTTSKRTVVVPDVPTSTVSNVVDEESLPPVQGLILLTYPKNNNTNHNKQSRVTSRPHQ